MAWRLLSSGQHRFITHQFDIPVEREVAFFNYISMLHATIKFQDHHFHLACLQWVSMGSVCRDPSQGIAKQQDPRMLHPTEIVRRAEEQASRELQANPRSALTFLVRHSSHLG